jgi:hypothetical protein
VVTPGAEAPHWIDTVVVVARVNADVNGSVEKTLAPTGMLCCTVGEMNELPRNTRHWTVAPPLKEANATIAFST